MITENGVFIRGFEISHAEDVDLVGFCMEWL